MRLKDLWRDTCGDVKVLNVRDGAEYFSSKDDAGAISKKLELIGDCEVAVVELSVLRGSLTIKIIPLEAED